MLCSAAFVGLWDYQTLKKPVNNGFEALSSFRVKSSPQSYLLKTGRI
jgi:hypothetical protein